MYDMFPKHVADALMRGERAPEDRRDCATILFCDIAGFTDLSAKLDSTQVSDMLDRLFQQFDALATLHGIHKVETIGDCYIGTALPAPATWCALLTRRGTRCFEPRRGSARRSRGAHGQVQSSRLISKRFGAGLSVFRLWP